MSAYNGSDKRLIELFNQIVEANPSGSAIASLQKLLVGGSIYSIPQPATSLVTLDDVDIRDDPPADGEVLTWDRHLNAWTNAGGGNTFVRYSTDETVAGTWLGGKTLYKKTIEITPLNNTGADTYVNHGISGITMVCGYEAFFSRPATGRCSDKNTDTNTQYVCSVFEANKTQIGYAIGSGWDFTHCYVTLKYVKS